MVSDCEQPVPKNNAVATRQIRARFMILLLRYEGRIWYHELYIWETVITAIKIVEIILPKKPEFLAILPWFTLYTSLRGGIHVTTRRTIVRWTSGSSARVLSESCLPLPQPEARPDEPLVLSLWLLLIPCPGKNPTFPVQTLWYDLIDPDLLHQLLDPSSHQPS